MSAFSYDEAFCRNIGIITEAEQQMLRKTCVGLPGLGGVGGGHLQTLARLGIGGFHLADLDTFEVANFNRQLGANLDTVGRAKVDVLAEVAQNINPACDVRTFPDGIAPDNIDDFLSGVDIVVDGLEFFAIDVRRTLYRACRRHRIPVVHAGPVGFGATLLVFLPGGISFDEHFRIDDGMTRVEMLLAHALGHSRGFSSDVDARHVDVNARCGPALASACLLCAALAGMEVLKLVTGRGRLAAAPRGIYFDPYRGRAAGLRPRPSLTRSLRGRLLRWFLFRRFPAFRALHEQELSARRLSSCDGNSIPWASTQTEVPQ
jgi:molybdopterin/thiamine biosynthesis adenylyltransferase